VIGVYQQGRNTVTNNYSTTNKSVVNRNSPTNQNYTRSSSQGANMGAYGGFSAMRSETPGQYQSSPPPGMTYARSDTPGQYQANPPPDGMMYSRSAAPEIRTAGPMPAAPRSNPSSPWDMYSQSRGGNQYRQNYDSAGSIRRLSSALNPGRGQTQEGQTGPNSWQRLTQNPNGTYTQTVAGSRDGLYGRTAGENNGPRYVSHGRLDPVTKRVLPPKVWV